MGISTKAIISDITRSGSQLEQLVREYDSVAADVVKKIVASVDAENISLAVMGKAKRGKSTLVNALLGRTDDVVAPVDRLPASSAVSCFTKAPADKATIVFQDGRQELVPFSRIRDFVTEEGNPDNKRGVRCLEIQSAFPSLEEHVVLVDTPGAGSIHEHHDALLYEFIPKADAVLFMITARMPMDQDETRLLSEIKKADIRRLFFIINRVDESEPQDLAELEEHSRRLLQDIGLEVGRFYRVSAKRAFDGDLANSGVPELLVDVQQAVVVARQPIIAQRTASRLLGAVRPIVDELEFKLSIAAHSAEEIGRQLTELKNQQKVELPRLQELQESFLKKWRAAIDEIDKKAGVSKSELVKDALVWVNDASSISLGAFVRDLPGKIHGEWMRRMGPTLETVQSKLARLVAELDAGVVKIEADLKPGTFTVKADSALVTAGDLVEGGVMIATGAGVGAIPSLVAASAATGWVATVAAWTTAPLWALCGPLGAVVIAAGAFTAFQGWRLSRERMRDRVGPAVSNYMDSLLSNMRDVTLPELRAQGEAIANTAKEQIATRRARLIKAAAEMHAHRPSVEETQELERIRDGLNSVLNEKVTPMTRVAAN